MVLSIRQLTKSFAASRRPVVAVPAFDLGAGEHLALRGTSGAGKTTFLHLIAGLLAPDTGTIAIDGEPMAPAPELARDRLRARRIGYVFQTFNLLQSCTVRENVALMQAFAGTREPERPAALLTRLGLGDLGHRFPAQLSTGQQQRVALARALVNRPRLVLADEPTASLDPQHAAEALVLLRDACAEAGAALLVVSHDERLLSAFPNVRDFAALNRP